MAWLAREEAAAEEEDSSPKLRHSNSSFLSPPPPNYQPGADVKTRTEPRPRASPRGRVAAATPSTTGLGSNPPSSKPARSGAASTGMSYNGGRAAWAGGAMMMGTPSDTSESSPDENNGASNGVKGHAGDKGHNGTGNELIDNMGKTMEKSWSSLKRVFEL